MAIPKFEADVEIISKLGDFPGKNDGLTNAGFKAKFDEGAVLFKKYINEVLAPELDKLVDVDALLADLLDDTLTKDDKAAPAKTVSDALKSLKRFYAKFFAAAVQGGEYIMQTDQNLAATLITANKVRISGGAYVTQGNPIALNVGSYVDIDVESGTTGTYRNDLICARFVRDEDGNEAGSVVLLKGSRERVGGVDPAYNVGDINAGGAVTHDTPLYRVCLNGLSATLEPMLTVQKNANRVSSVVTLSASSWVDNEQRVNVDGATADPLETDIFASADPSDENYAAYTENGVRPFKQLDGAVIFKCDSVPGIDISVSVSVLK